MSTLALVLVWAGPTAHAQFQRQNQPAPGAQPADDNRRDQGWQGLGPIERSEQPGQPQNDAEAAGLRGTGEAPATEPNASRTVGAQRDRLRAQSRRAPWQEQPRQAAPLTPNAGVAAPAAVTPPARQLSSRPAPMANRRTGRLPRPTGAAPASTTQRLATPASRAPRTGAQLSISREDQRALQAGTRGIATPNQPPRPADVPIVTDRVQPINGRVLPNANPLGRNTVIDPRTGEVISYDRRPQPETDAFTPIGLRLGSFVVTPVLDSVLGYDSNSRRVSTAIQGSAYNQTYGEVSAKSDWSRHELTARIRGTYSAYFSTPDVNRPELAMVANGRIDVTRDTRIETEARYNLTAQSPGSSNLPSAAGTSLSGLPLVRQYGGTVGVVQDINRLQLTLRGTLDRYTYDDAVTQNGTVIQQGERNYNAYGGRLRASYELTPGMRPFVEAGVERRVFDTLLATSGYLQGSTAQTFRVGSTFELTRLVTGEISAGYLVRRDVDPTLREIRMPVFDAALTWTPTGLTTVRFVAKSTVDESFTTGAAGIQRRDVSVELEHAFRRWLIGTAKLAYGNDLYAGTTRQDQRLVASLGVVYKANRMLQIRGEVRREQLFSNTSGSGYSANVFLLGLRLMR
ncbi:hypothetical protein E8L99_02185 [Phreatobacter aquaticus]|uniref:Outer membrane beta-barrel protein n=1 Tax=Phreatobacter aquaticus TaxID=2570229 RepID=A0A4D7QDG6_9HYPH|nr:outer membrane beta-barrel protein [Phreatobacter aquaticus]QCK84675.1 hypothetical protein E8L99_02185 [Phreatobacter aquaticus]